MPDFRSDAPWQPISSRPCTVLHLTPLIRARRRLERLAAASDALARLTERQHWLNLPLLPAQLLLRTASRHTYRQVERAYGLPSQPFWRSR